jgi:hypothetical protein
MASRRTPDLSKAPDPTPARASAAQPPGRARKPPTLGLPRVQVSADERRRLIAENAYLRAERRGFVPGHETEDWLAAEAEVDALLRVGGNSPQ